jgi:hypothetical protein
MSPFMTGLLLGMTVFSALSLQWAKAELVAMQERKTQQDRAQAQELASAMEFAVLTEDASGYSDEYNLQRARAFSSAGGRTRGGNEVLAAARSDEADESGSNSAFGMENTQVAFTASDDRFARAAAGRAGDAATLQQEVGAKGPTVLANVRAARERQVLTSSKRMDAMADQMFAYYAAKMRFPDEASYTNLESRLNLKDAWGQRFEYEPAPDGQSATLRFTTPWDYTRERPLSLKE